LSSTCRHDGAGGDAQPRGGHRSYRTVSRTPCTAHSSGRSCVHLVNLRNVAAYVVARIVPVPLSGQIGSSDFTRPETWLVPLKPVVSRRLLSRPLRPSCRRNEGVRPGDRVKRANTFGWCRTPA
jgi:hypothetical protein